MIFNDGSTGLVPQEKVIGAIQDGGEVAHHMRFKDGSEAYVPHSKYDGALADGGKPLDAPDQMPTLSKLTQGNVDNSGVPTAQGATGLAIDVAGMGAMMLPEIGAGLKAAKAVAATEEATPTFKHLYQIAKAAEQQSEVTGNAISSAGWKAVSEGAARSAAAAGDMVSAAGYKGAAALAKAVSAYDAAWAWVGKTLPWLPLGLRIYYTQKAARDGVDAVSRELSGDKEAKQ
jgi:hypothetical protein